MGAIRARFERILSTFSVSTPSAEAQGVQQSLFGAASNHVLQNQVVSEKRRQDAAALVDKKAAARLLEGLRRVNRLDPKAKKGKSGKRSIENETLDTFDETATEADERDDPANR